MLSDKISFDKNGRFIAHVRLMDGNQWCALYGDNIQDGLAGFGDTPALAVKNFNHNYYNQKIGGAA